jgi:CheY-like chemotaxis protein
MIVSFEVEVDIANNKTLPIIWKFPNSPIKTPALCHQTLLQLMDYVDEINGIILPGEIPNQIEYDVICMLDHIRLLDNEKLNRIPIGVVDCTNDTSDIIINRDDGVEPFPDRIVNIFPSESLSDIKLQKIIGIIGNKKPYAEHHGLANEWGQYRLLSQLNQNGEFDDDLNEIRQNLSEVRYFKKLLLNEKKELTINSVNDRFNKLLNNLRKIKLNVAIIDDKVKYGWDKAYGAMLANSQITCFDEVSKKFNENNSSDFDLIILDLRLKEEVSHDDSEIFGIENLSGIELLKKIKKCDPSVPVIMCTASNKSWSYDAAINAGADGFWTKESPDFGMSLVYRFNNTVDLLKTVDKVLSWSRDIRPLYKGLNKIYDNVSEVNVVVGESVQKKINIVYSQLHSQKSKFIEKNYGQGGLVTAYLAICSLVNDVVSFYRINEDGTFYVTINNHKYEFCKKMEEENSVQFELVDDVIHALINDKYKPRPKSYLFPEKPFMYFLLEKSGMGDRRGLYSYLSKIRNHLDIIHSKSMPENFDQDFDLELKHLYQMLNIFHFIFVRCELENQYVAD